MIPIDDDDDDDNDSEEGGTMMTMSRNTKIEIWRMRRI